MAKVKRSHKKGMGMREVSSDVKVDDTPEHQILMGHESRHWQVRVDEGEAFGAVRVLNAAGELVRIIAVEELRRPWKEKEGNTWNNSLFPRRNSGKV